MIRLIAAMAFSLFVCAAAPVSAATQRGVGGPGGSVTVSGTVFDATQGVVPGAAVEAIVAGRAVATATADARGAYTLAVPAGVPFRLRVRRDGFAEEIVEWPGAAAAVTRDVSLALGRLSDTVVITAARGPESPARVTESVSVITSADIEALGAVSLADVVRGVP